MLEAADFCAVLAHPEEVDKPGAALLLMVPRQAPGRRVDMIWDTLGMRATRSDSLILEDCFVSEDAVLYQTDDILPFIRSGANWLWASYTAVYLGVAAAAYNAVRELVRERVPRGYTQPMAYHPDVRRRVADMSVDLEAARLLTYQSAWLSDTQGPTLGNPGGAVPCQVFGRRGWGADHAYGSHAGRSACALQNRSA